MNEAKALTAEVLGKEAEEYPGAFDMEDIGNIPLALISKMPAMYSYGYQGSGNLGVDGRLQNAMQAASELTGGNKENRPDGDSEKDAQDVDMDLDTQRNKTTDQQLDSQIAKAASNGDDEVVAIMKEVKRLLLEMGGGSDE